MKMIYKSENKLKLSPNFTVDDIHKIPEWYYRSFKNSPTKEWIYYINKSADEARAMSGLKFEIKNGMYIHRKEEKM
jgi:hypothetical protein